MELLKNCPVCGSNRTDLFMSGKDYFLTQESFTIVKCADCGFRFTNPRPKADELGRYYESTEYISHSDARKGLFAWVYQQIRKYTLVRKLSMISSYRKKGKILDIGCATGQFLHFMYENGWETTGVEPDEKTRNRAISEYGLQVFDEDQLDNFIKSSFDVITMWHVLEHVSDLNKRVEQLKDILLPGGIVIVAVPNCESWDAEKYGTFWAGYDLPRHLYHFTRSDMKVIFEKHGFSIETILPMRFDSYYVSLLSEKYKYGEMRWLPAIWNGFWSNLNAGNVRGHSSLIYVLKLQ